MLLRRALEHPDLSEMLPCQTQCYLHSEERTIPPQKERFFQHEFNKKPLSTVDMCTYGYQFLFYLLQLVLVQVGSFITVWTPYVVVSGLSLVYSLPVWVTVIPTMFAKLSCAVNPITYSLLNRTFRRMSRDIFCRCALRKVSHSSDKYRPSNR